MKHLKRFNEKISFNEVKDMVDSHLAYLIDDGFSVEYFNYFDKIVIYNRGSFSKSKD